MSIKNNTDNITLIFNKVNNLPSQSIISEIVNLRIRVQHTIVESDMGVSMHPDVCILTFEDSEMQFEFDSTGLCDNTVQIPANKAFVISVQFVMGLMSNAATTKIMYSTEYPNGIHENTSVYLNCSPGND